MIKSFNIIRGTEQIVTPDGTVNKIIKYEYNITNNSGNAITTGYLTRDEYDDILFSYSSKGLNETRAEICKRYKKKFNSLELSRILSTFGINKSSDIHSPHKIEENTIESLVKDSIYLDGVKEVDKIYKLKQKYYKDATVSKVAQNEIKRDITLDVAELFNSEIDFSRFPVIKNNTPVSSENNLMLHFADFHIGAEVSDTTPVKNTWNEEELYKRLHKVLIKIVNFNLKFDTIVINILGDMIDGMDGMTARRDHFLPQNMSNTEQARVYIESIIWFVSQLHSLELCNQVKIYSVKCGNHGGDYEYIVNKSIELALKNIFPDFVDFTLFDKFLNHYEFQNRLFIITHGKDEKDMKRNWPLNLNPDVKGKLHEYLRNNKIDYSYEDINIIKGDLHSENINTTEFYTYRNCLSLFGSSAYCQLNYSENTNGMSYELFLGEDMIRGTFTRL